MTWSNTHVRIFLLSTIENSYLVKSNLNEQVAVGISRWYQGSLLKIVCPPALFPHLLQSLQYTTPTPLVTYPGSPHSKSHRGKSLEGLTGAHKSLGYLRCWDFWGNWALAPRSLRHDQRHGPSLQIATASLFSDCRRIHPANHLDISSPWYLRFGQPLMFALGSHPIPDSNFFLLSLTHAFHHVRCSHRHTRDFCKCPDGDVCISQPWLSHPPEKAPPTNETRFEASQECVCFPFNHLDLKRWREGPK